MHMQAQLRIFCYEKLQMCGVRTIVTDLEISGSAEHSEQLEIEHTAIVNQSCVLTEHIVDVFRHDYNGNLLLKFSAHCHSEEHAVRLINRACRMVKFINSVQRLQ